MILTPFKIGLALITIGMVWTAMVFDQSDKTHETVLLKESSSAKIKSVLSGTDIGYYKLYMPEFAGEEIFLQILDSRDNVIQEQMVQTKLSVGYFDFTDGEYTAKVTNIAENPTEIQIEFGNTNSHKMQLSGVMILVGSLILMAMSYVKIKNYSIEQPEENIS